jgi:glycosyltransferase EpsD
MKILYVTTVGSTMMFFVSLIKELLQRGDVVDLACSKTDEIPNELIQLGCKVFPLSCSRSPFKIGNLKAIKEIKKIVGEQKYDIVHCHTPIAAVCTRLACKRLRNSGLKVFYTAHGFHFYKGAPIKNWLVFYPVEKLCSRWTDALITINTEDYNRAKKMHCKNVYLVNGVGVDIDKIRNIVMTNESINEKKISLGVESMYPLIFYAAEINKNKNQKLLLEVEKVLISRGYNPCILLAGTDDTNGTFGRRIIDDGLSKSVRLLGFRKDCVELIKISDICCPTSIREGLPINLIEAMAGGLPVVATRNRGHKSIIQDGFNGFLCNFDANEISERIIFLLQNDDARKTIIKNAINNCERFSIQEVNKAMLQIYSDNIS